jgi:hypothetical protein
LVLRLASTDLFQIWQSLLTKALDPRGSQLKNEVKSGDSKKANRD